MQKVWEASGGSQRKFGKPWGVFEERRLGGSTEEEGRQQVRR
jgi:hypothetical protein